jgi:hypothetical protein
MLRNYEEIMSIGGYMDDETLGNIDALINDFYRPQDISGFTIRLVDFLDFRNIAKPDINYIMSLIPSRIDTTYCDTGDNRRRDFKADKNTRRKFTKKLKKAIVERKYPCSIKRYIQRFNSKGVRMLYKTKNGYKLM